MHLSALRFTAFFTVLFLLAGGVAAIADDKKDEKKDDKKEEKKIELKVGDPAPTF